MQTYISIENARFSLVDKSTFIIQYVYRGNEDAGNKVGIYFDKTPVEYKTTEYRDFEVRQRYVRYGADIDTEYLILFKVPEDYLKYKKLKVKVENGTKSVTVMSIKTDGLKKMRNSVMVCYDNVSLNKNRTLNIRGWYASINVANISLTDEKGIPIDCEVKHVSRNDVTGMFREAEFKEKLGFEIKADNIKTDKIVVVVDCGTEITKSHVNVKKAMSGSIGFEDIKRLFLKTINYIRIFGIKRTLKKIVNKVAHTDSVNYTNYVKMHSPTKEELDRQRRESFEYEPVFSILIPLYKTNARFLRELLDSLLNQTYKKVEICLSDGSGDKTILESILKEYAAKDSRVKYSQLDKACQISENTNNALTLATGDYIVLCDHDDLLPADAMYECVKAINENKGTDVIYTDEDKIDMEGKKYFEPHFKPDFNIDLLRSVNYICHLFVVKKQIVDKVGGFNSEFDGAQDYDFIFRCTEEAENIYHIPKVLYHWRAHMDSTAENPESKLYAFEAGKRAIAAHLKRQGIKGHVTDGLFYGIYRTHYDVIGEPLISIVIPNKDHIVDLKKCMDSIYEKSVYRNFEFVIVENNSTEPETFEFYKKLEAEKDNVKVVYWKDEFNYSAINNFGVKAADGEYILLLNNDTEIINEDCLKELLSVCQRDEVGIVGARLYYEDDTIQHAGVVVGFGGIAGHTFIGQSRFEPGYFARAMCTQDYSAVTAACLMTKKSVYEEVGGLTEEFKVAFNDIDFCMKVRKTGRLVVYNAFAELYHYESKSRGAEDTPEKIARFNSEIARFRDRWPEILEKGDPYYNPNLTLNKSDFSLREN